MTTPSRTPESLFKINDKPLTLSPTQKLIFDSILYQIQPRVQCITPTQYGKSLVVSCATLLRAITYQDRFVILAPSQKKANIIMGYVIDHCFDDPLFYKQLEYDSSNSLDRLRRERNKNHITFKNGGGVMTLTLNAREQKASIEAAMGFGGNRLILDESALIDDLVYSTVKRMLGGYAYDDTFLFEIGNPFYRNHFHRTWHDPLYHHIFIDYIGAMAEGRFDPRFIEEMRNEALFDVFYECKFPNEDELDDKGFRFLIKSDELINWSVPAVEKRNLPQLGVFKLGVDIGGGNDFSTFVIRHNKHAWIEKTHISRDTMTNVVIIEELMKKYNIPDREVYVDDTGIGMGVSDRCKEKGLRINAVVVGRRAKNKKKYANIKAEAYFSLRDWLKDGGRLQKDLRFEELNQIKYKLSSDKVYQIEPKEELKKRTKGKSPDHAEGLMLTFAHQRGGRRFGSKPAGF